MLQSFRALRRTDKTACAAHIDFALFGEGFAVAFRTSVGKIEGCALRVPCQVFHKLWNNVTGALHDHAIAGAHAEPCDLVAIV